MVCYATPEDSSRILWVYTYPLGAIFLFGNKTGFLWSSLLLISIVLIFRTFFLNEQIYTYPFQVRFTLIYAVITCMITWIEYHRNLYQNESIEIYQVLLEEKQQLLDQNTKLASYVHKVLAESVAYMKKMVGEIEDSQFEESLVELSKKSSRDLKEMMVGLADKKVTRIINHVHLNDGEEVEESASAQKKDEANIEKLASMLEKIFIKK